MSFNNNLIRNQLVGQLEMLRAMPMAELSKPERILMASLPKQIAQIDAGMIAEKAAAAQKAHHEETVAKHKEAKAMKKAGKRVEQESFSMYSDKTIQCGDCGEGFAFSGRQQEKRKVVPPELITCKECNKEFKFGYGEQMFFKEHGWQEPRRCIPCRKEHKAEYAAKYAAKVAARAKPDLGKFAEGADPNMKFGPLPPSPASSSSATSEGVINPADLIAAARSMVNGDGTFNTGKEEGWQTVGPVRVP